MAGPDATIPRGALQRCEHCAHDRRAADQLNHVAIDDG